MENKIFINGPWLAIGHTPDNAARLLATEIVGFYLGVEDRTWVVLRGGEKLEFSGNLVTGLDAILGLNWPNDPVYISPPRHDRSYGF